MRFIDADDVLKKMDMLTENKDKLSDFYSGLDTGRELIENALEERGNMKIEDMQTLPEFFGVKAGDDIWIEGQKYYVSYLHLNGAGNATLQNSKALVGCLTGQLKWSTTEPMTADEEKVLREIAEWFPWWKRMYLTSLGDIQIGQRSRAISHPFWSSSNNSKAYEVLAPILEKYGEINLEEYREAGI